MKGMLAILGFELRLLRRDLLFGVAISIAVFASLVMGESSGGGSALAPVLRGSVLLVFVLIGIVRVSSADAAWAGLRGSLPISAGKIALSRFSLWAIMALLPSCAYVLWTTAPPWRLLEHVYVVWLWILTAGMAAGLVGVLRRRGAQALDGVFLAFTGLVLVGAFPAVVTGGETWLGLEAAPGLLLAGLLWALIRGLATTSESLPAQSPKEVRPRSRWTGGLLKGRTRARSPAQVLAHLGVNRARISPISLLLWIGVFSFIANALTADTSARSAEDRLAPVFAVLISGLYISLELRQASARWAFLRTYPLSRASVWAGPVAAMVVVSASCVGSFMWTQRDSRPATIVASVAVSMHPHSPGDPTLWIPALYAPHWVCAEGATSGRPAGMPAAAWGRWRLRKSVALILGMRAFEDTEELEASDGADEQRYFVDTLRFYLDLVHGVDVAEEDLQSALGEPFLVDSDTELIPAQHFYEYAHIHGQPVLRFEQDEGSIRFFMDGSGIHARRLGLSRDFRAAEKFVATPSSMYAFAPAIERLQVLIADRLARAASLRSVLDLCLLLLAILLFARFALIEGPLRFAMPLLALLQVGLWFNGQATVVYRTVRDAHLAYPWIAAALTAIVAALLLVSIRRQLGRATPPALARQETRV